MITITFPDRETEKRAIGFLLGRFSGRILKSGQHIVPEAALEALAEQQIEFTVLGKTTYAQHLAALRLTIQKKTVSGCAITRPVGRRNSTNLIFGS